VRDAVKPLVVFLALGIVQSVSGCLGDNVEREGDFSAVIGVDLVQAIDASGGMVWGVRTVTMESDLPPDEVYNAMRIDGLGEFDTRGVQLETGEVGIWKARGDIEYFDQREHMDFFIAAVEDVNSTFLVVVDHTHLEEDPSVPPPTGLTIEPVENLTSVHQAQMGAILSREADGGDNLTVRISLPPDAGGNVTYLCYQSREGATHRYHTTVISPGEVHLLTVVDTTHVHITVTGPSSPAEPSFDGRLSYLPIERSPNLDRRAWEGHAKDITGGECVTSVLGPLALVTVAMVSPGRSRSTRPWL
jgi:hypothetical protein